MKVGDVLLPFAGMQPAVVGGNVEVWLDEDGGSCGRGRGWNPKAGDQK